MMRIFDDCEVMQKAVNLGHILPSSIMPIAFICGRNEQVLRRASGEMGQPSVVQASLSENVLSRKASPPFMFGASFVQAPMDTYS